MKFLVLSALILMTNFVFAASEDEPPAATSTIKADGTPAVRSPFGISFFMIGGYSDQQFRNERPSFDVFDSYLSFNYRINKNLRFGVRPAFGYSTDGFNRYGDKVDDKARVRDISILATMYNIGEDVLPPELQIKFQPRLYLPTSDSSKDQGTIARLRTEVEARYGFGRYSNLRYKFKPSYYFQRNTTYVNNNSPKKDVRTTSLADLEQIIEVSFDLNKYFALQPGVTFNDDWSNESDANNKERFHSSTMTYGMGLEVRPTRAFNFIMMLQTKQDLINTAAVDETSYVLMVNASLL